MEKKKTKLKKWQKALIIILCIILVPIIALFGFALVNTLKSAKRTSATSAAPAAQEPAYIDIQKSDIKEALPGTVTITSLNGFNGDAVRKKLLSGEDFSYAAYYDLDAVLDTMENTQIKKKTDLRVLDSNNHVDAEKLYQSVLRNNEAAKQKTGGEKLNTFYSDATPEEIKKICLLTAKTVNASKGDRDIRDVASVLARLKIFRNETSSSLAAVTQDITFIFNPKMIDITRTAFEISGRNNKDFDEETLTFVHEIEHIKQYASSDDNEKNGVEAGFCRRYEGAKVNALWNQWLLEAAAEMKMAKQLQTTPMNYAKKITYANSYELAYIFDKSKSFHALPHTTFENDLTAAFQKLQLSDKPAQRDFLNLLYSIQLTQYECEDFWEYYAQQTGKSLSDEARTAIKMDIRAEAVRNLTRKYYESLLQGIENHTIEDLESAFYMMKLWELDCFTHLSYTQKDALAHAKDVLAYLNEIQTLMLRALAKSTGKQEQAIAAAYGAYHPFVKENGKVQKNYRFHDLDSERASFIDACFDGYSVTYFADVKSMLPYIGQ